MVNALLEGVDAIRRNLNYTPESSVLESPRTTQHRREHAFLYNKFKQLSKMFSSRPFKKGLAYKNEGEPPPFFVKFRKNVDAKQNDIVSFSLRTFETALTKGTAYLILDVPDMDTNKIRSVRDDIEDPILPYWVLIQPEQVLDAIKDREGNITDFRYYLVHDYIDAQLEEQNYYEVRHFHDNVLDIYTNQAKPDIFQMVERIENTEVRFYCFETDADSAPLGDLADMNLRHWQLNSVLQLSTVYFDYPILTGTNLPENFNINRDYQTVVHLEEGQELKFVHPNTPGSAPLARYVKELEEKMIAFGSRLDSAMGGESKCN